MQKSAPALQTGYLRKLFSRQRIITVAIAGCGCLLFYLIKAPLPFLLGPMCCCLLFALAGVRLQDTGKISTAMRTVVGIAIGVALTPTALARLPEMAWSLLLIPLMLLIVAAITIPLLSRVCKLDAITTLCSVLPGAIQDMINVGTVYQADVRAITMLQSARIVLTLLLVPPVLAFYFDIPLSSIPGNTLATTPVSQLILMLLIAIAGWAALAALAVPGAPIIGPLVVTTIFNQFGIITHRPPTELIIIAQFFLGMTIGVRYSGIKWREIYQYLVASTINLLVLFGCAIGLIYLVQLLGLANDKDSILAFIPGGQGDMVIIAIASGADLAYVALHHIWRVVLAIILTPVAVKLIAYLIANPLDNRGHPRNE